MGEAARGRNRQLSLVSDHSARIDGPHVTDIAAETRVDIFQHGLDEVRRYLGKNARVCFIGDTPADILAARSVRASVIAVATGIFDMETLRQERPDLCLPYCSALLECNRP